METAKKFKKFTFKTVQPTGRYRSFQSACHYIKLNGIEVGSIHENPISIRLKVYKTAEELLTSPTCNWRWKTVAITKPEPWPTIQHAKDFINRKYVEIQEKFNIVKE